MSNKTKNKTVTRAIAASFIIMGTLVTDSLLGTLPAYSMEMNNTATDCDTAWKNCFSQWTDLSDKWTEECKAKNPSKWEKIDENHERILYKWIDVESRKNEGRKFSIHDFSSNHNPSNSDIPGALNSRISSSTPNKTPLLNPYDHISGTSNSDLIRLLQIINEKQVAKTSNNPKIIELENNMNQCKEKKDLSSAREKYNHEIFRANKMMMDKTLKNLELMSKLNTL